jgi:hypothetical protein
MSSGEVNGKTAENVSEYIEENYVGTVHEKNGIPPKAVFCLAEINKQPDDYDGPQRYCVSYSTQRAENPTEPEDFSPKCRLHGGESLTGDDVTYAEEHFESSYPPNFKHGMYSTDEHLLQFLDEKEKKLYDRIMSWAEVYGFEEEDDPASYQMLRTLAIEEVRKAKSAEYLLEEGETDDSPVFDSQGNLHEREDTTNALSEEHQKQVKLTLRLMKELGITPKERSKMDTEEREASATEDIAEIAKAALDSDSGSYDPDSYD